MNKKLVLLLVPLFLWIGGGCMVPGLLTQPTPTPVIIQPTPTVAPPPVTPLPPDKEIEAANALEAQIIAVYDTVGRSVVNITNRSYVYDMFMRAVPQEGSGSGFVYDAQGHIITNYHVIENASEIVVNLANGDAYAATLVGADPTNDLAVIRIDAGENLPPPVSLGDSDKLRVGQFVVAIGNPFGQGQTLTTGVISALGRVIQSPQDNRFIGEAIQTDAAINPGNSGGPLLDLQGRVIGVNSQIISPSGASAGIGFAVSANTVRRIIPDLIARGYYPHPWLGTEMLPLSASIADTFRQTNINIPVDSGLLVINAVKGGPADKAGIRGGNEVVQFGRYRIPVGGDIITAINGRPINDYKDLTVYLETQTVVGDTVQVTVLRDGQEMTFAVTLEERPQQ